MELLWGSLLLVAACVPAAQGWPEGDLKDADLDMPQPLHLVEEGNLKVLTAAGLTQMLNQTRFLMVLFHNPSSKQSRKLAKELGKAVEIVGKNKNGVGFGRVDITVEKELCKEFDVEKAPELKLFFEGNRTEPINCEGVVEAAALVVWLRRQISQKAFLFTDTEQVAEFVKTRPLVIIGFFQDLEEEAAELFFDVIKDFPELTFGVMSISNAFGRFHVILDSVLVFSKGNIVNRQELINDSTNKNVLNQVIKPHLTGFVIEYNTENKGLIYELQVMNHMLLFASKRARSFAMIMQHYKLAVKEFQSKQPYKVKDIIITTLQIKLEQRGEITVLPKELGESSGPLTSYDEPKNRHIFEYFQITEANVPSVQILNLSSDARYKMPFENITFQNLKHFGRRFLSRSAKKHQSSEEVPKYWDQGPVKQLVGKNFHLVAFDKERDVFVMFYAPWSAVCRALFPVLEELGLRYQNHSTLTIAKIDITANDVPLTDPDRYPFFRLFPTNSQPAVPYKGEHTVRGFSDFLESQVQTGLRDAAELSSVEPSEEVGEEALAKEELPEQKSPELGNVTRLEEPGQEAAAEEEREGAKPKGPPGRRKRPGVKEEL